jgi:hypothetical protein
MSNKLTEEIIKKELNVDGLDLDSISEMSKKLYEEWQTLIDTKINEALAFVGITDIEEEGKQDPPRISMYYTNDIGGTTTIKFHGATIFEYYISTSVDLANPVMTLKYKTIVHGKG